MHCDTNTQETFQTQSAELMKRFDKLNRKKNSLRKHFERVDPPNHLSILPIMNKAQHRARNCARAMNVSFFCWTRSMSAMRGSSPLVQCSLTWCEDPESWIVLFVIIRVHLEAKSRLQTANLPALFVRMLVLSKSPHIHRKKPR